MIKSKGTRIYFVLENTETNYEEMAHKKNKPNYQEPPSIGEGEEAKSSFSVVLASLLLFRARNMKNSVTSVFVVQDHLK